MSADDLFLLFVKNMDDLSANYSTSLLVVYRFIDVINLYFRSLFEGEPLTDLGYLSMVVFLF